jgi:hypothetical protein
MSEATESENTFEHYLDSQKLETQQKQPVTNKKGHRLHEAQPC